MHGRRPPQPRQQAALHLLLHLLLRGSATLAHLLQRTTAAAPEVVPPVPAPPLNRPHYHHHHHLFLLLLRFPLLLALRPRRARPAPAAGGAAARRHSRACEAIGLWLLAAATAMQRTLITGKLLLRPLSTLRRTRGARRTALLWRCGGAVDRLPCADVHMMSSLPSTWP